MRRKCQSLCRPTKASLSLPSSSKCVSHSFDTSHISVAQSQLSSSESTNARPINAQVPPAISLLRLLASLPLENDTVFLGLSPALGLSSASGSHDALAHVHGHLLLLMNRQLRAKGLDAQVGRLLAGFAGCEGLGCDGGAGSGACGGEEVGLGEETAEFEILREEGGSVFGEGGSGG